MEAEFRALTRAVFRATPGGEPAHTPGLWVAGKVATMQSCREQWEVRVQKVCAATSGRWDCRCFPSLL